MVEHAENELTFNMPNKFFKLNRRKRKIFVDRFISKILIAALGLKNRRIGKCSVKVGTYVINDTGINLEFQK